MKKRLLIILCLVAFFAQAQQDRQFSHYNYDRISYNPATIGFKGICGTFLHRNQWDKVENAPVSTLVNFQGNIPRRNLGVGMSYTYDALGFQKNHVLTMGAATHQPIGVGTLSAGVAVGFMNIGFSPDWIPPTNAPDPNIPAGIAKTAFTTNVGLFFQGRQNYYVGISATNLVPVKLEEISFATARHYYLLMGYNTSVNIGGRRVDLKPNILVKSDAATAIFDINFTADFWLNSNSYVWGGFSYRLSDGIPIMVGYAFKPQRRILDDPENSWKSGFLKVGYSFDIMTNQLRQFGKGSHELMLSYCLFPPKKSISRHSNPFILQ